MRGLCWSFTAEMYRSARPYGGTRLLQLCDKLFRELRREFTWCLARARGRRAEQTRCPIATVWCDAHGRIGNAQVIPHLAPQCYDISIPLVPRIAVNSYVVGMNIARINRIGCPVDRSPWPAMERPRLILSVAPEELIDFVPWIANLVEHHESEIPLQEPPHPCDVRGAELRDALEVWTGKARDEVRAYEEERERLLLQERD